MQLVVFHSYHLFPTSLVQIPAIVATDANAQQLPPSHYLVTVGNVAKSAEVVLRDIQNTHDLIVDGLITGFINLVRRYTLNARRGDTGPMAKVTKALEKIAADIERLHQ
ncbi:hypothetical protein N7490_011604 [Penicillium lividum]|nr:hypothetical protein N7490_011604 [Penicillium lividum]